MNYKEGISVLETDEYRALPNGQIIRTKAKIKRNDINPDTGMKYKKELRV